MHITLEAETGLAMLRLCEVPQRLRNDFARWRGWLPSVHGDLEPPPGWCWLDDYLMFRQATCASRQGVAHSPQ